MRPLACACLVCSSQPPDSSCCCSCFFCSACLDDGRPWCVPGLRGPISSPAQVDCGRGGNEWGLQQRQLRRFQRRGEQRQQGREAKGLREGNGRLEPGVHAGCIYSLCTLHWVQDDSEDEFSWVWLAAGVGLRSLPCSAVQGGSQQQACFFPLPCLFDGAGAAICHC